MGKGVRNTFTKRKKRINVIIFKAPGKNRQRPTKRESLNAFTFSRSLVRFFLRCVCGELSTFDRSIRVINFRQTLSRTIFHDRKFI